MSAQDSTGWSTGGRAYSVTNLYGEYSAGSPFVSLSCVCVYLTINKEEKREKTLEYFNKNEILGSWAPVQRINLFITKTLL